jgi:uncharacterized protein
MSKSAPAAAAARIQLVVKISKYCNLRCTYCYEYEELSNKARMSLDNVERMFRNLRPALDGGLISGIEFIWHGGEPFLIPIESYRQIGAIQKRVLPADTYQNVVQTNLTVLTDRHIEFLKNEEFFTSVGVSYDVFGDHRVDGRGRLRNDAVMANLEKLIEHDISFGAISVLTRDSIAHARQIQKFWEELGRGFRFLPFYLSVGDAQSRKHGLTGQQQVAVMKQCFLDWLASEKPVNINPISEYLVYALEYLAGGARARYEPARSEIIYVVNVDGSMFGIGRSDLYRPDFSYGNIFASSFVDILASDKRKVATADAYARMERHCGSCRYFGHCPGHPVADASREDLAIIESDGCMVAHVVDFMIDTLAKSDVADELLFRLKAGAATAPAAGTSAAVRL